MPIVHTRSYQFCFSLNKQADIATAVGRSLVNKKRSLRTFAPSRQEEPAKVSDRTWFGKGHSFPTFSSRIQQRELLPAQERSASSIEALFAAAFVMGKVDSSPLGGGEWQHIVTWQDIATNKECHYTSIVEKMGSEWQRILTGVVISQFTITGARNDHVTISFEGHARKSADDVDSIPDITPASFYHTLFGTLKFGLTGAPLDISNEVLSYTLTFNQNPQPYHLMGNPAGDEKLVTQYLIGDQAVSGNVIVRASALHRSRYLDQSPAALELNIISPDVIAADHHSIKIELPHIVLNNEAFGEDGQTVSYTLSLNEDAILKVDPDEQAKLTFVSDIDDTELLVQA